MEERKFRLMTGGAEGRTGLVKKANMANRTHEAMPCYSVGKSTGTKDFHTLITHIFSLRFVMFFCMWFYYIVSIEDGRGKII